MFWPFLQNLVVKVESISFCAETNVEWIPVLKPFLALYVVYKTLKSSIFLGTSKFAVIKRYISVFTFKKISCLKAMNPTKFLGNGTQLSNEWISSKKQEIFHRKNFLNHKYSAHPDNCQSAKFPSDGAYFSETKWDESEFKS